MGAKVGETAMSGKSLSLAVLCQVGICRLWATYCSMLDIPRLARIIFPKDVDINF